MDAGQSTTFALMALGVLRDVALASDVYNIVDAQPALIQALADDRPDIVVGAATVLSLINTPEAQIAIADYALSTMADVQLALLESLADSATHFGNLLNGPQKQQLIDLVSNSDGELAATAARAHGALTLPTSEAVKEILRF
jgi:HEAT repeat protein